MEIAHKNLPVSFKADGDSGQFTALVSVFNNIDSVGDRMKPGAFKGTLERWRESGDPIPVVFNHDWGSPDAHIGVADPRAVYESEEGLVVQGQLDIADNPVARQVYKLLKRRSLKEFSFGYKVPQGGEKRAKDGANDILEVDLIEVGPTLKGANPATELQAVKSAVQGKPDPATVLLEAGQKRWAESDVAVEHIGDAAVVFGVDGGLRSVKFDSTALTLADEEVEVECIYRPKSLTSTATSPRLIEDGNDEEPEKAKSAPQDPLKQDSLAIALEVLSDGASLHKYEEEQKPPPPEPRNEDSQRRSLCDLLLN